MKYVLSLIVVCLAAGLYLNTSILNQKGDYLSFYKSIDSNNLSFNLYEIQSSPFTENTIKTLDASYDDLIKLGENPEYKIKISQMEHESAMDELKAFYTLIKNMNECNSSLGQKLYKVCNNEKNKVKSKKLLKYVNDQVLINAKVPYKSAKDYFYLNFKSIINER